MQEASHNDLLNGSPFKEKGGSLKATTQAERLGQVLKALKPDISEEDRKAALESEQITEHTMVKYLKGIVNNNDRAARLIELFRARIAEREKLISQ